MRPSLPASSLLGACVLLGLVAGGCSAYHVSEPKVAVLHPFAAIPADFARVCAIRTELYAAQLAFPTYDNNQLVGVTKGATFFCYKAEPGDHVVRIDSDPPFALDLHAEAGKSYYIHEQVPVELVPRCMATLVDEGRARELVEASTYETTAVAHGEAAPDPVPYAKAIHTASR
ncbi:MAG TPA: hypothetical protein VLT33_32150 [Labilithrix sp.]|nr:hypothetical protein [Labilithrix sp.]